VQVQAPAGGSWLTITRKDVQASAPVPDTFGAPFPWQGSLPVPNGVVNIWNGNLHLGLSLFGWGGQAGVAFGLFYNAQDTRQGVLGVGWRHSYEASLEFVPDHNPPLVIVNEPDGRRLAFAQQPDGSYVPMRGVYSQLRHKNGQYELIRPSQVRWVFDSAGRLIAIRDLHNQGVSLTYDAAGRLVQITDSVGRSAFAELLSGNGCGAGHEPACATPVGGQAQEHARRHRARVAVGVLSAAEGACP
jgi:YD repeat-containing protein